MISKAATIALYTERFVELVKAAHQDDELDDRILDIALAIYNGDDSVDVKSAIQELANKSNLTVRDITLLLQDKLSILRGNSERKILQLEE